MDARLGLIEKLCDAEESNTIALELPRGVGFVGLEVGFRVWVWLVAFRVWICIPCG